MRDCAAVPDEIGPAVAHLRQVQLVAQDGDGGDRGAHAAHFGMFLGVLVDLRVGALHRLLEPEREALRRGLGVLEPGFLEVGEDHVRGHRARDFTRRGAAHAVGHHEQGALGTHLVVPHLGLETRIAGREIGSLWSRVRPRSVLPKTETRTGPVGTTLLS